MKMDKKDINVYCSSKGGILLFFSILLSVLSIIIIVSIITSKSDEPIYVQFLVSIFMIIVSMYFILSYINIKIEISNNIIKYSNLYGRYKVFYINELKKEKFVGTTGRKYIFSNGSFTLYSYYKNYEDAIRYIDNWKKK